MRTRIWLSGLILTLTGAAQAGAADSVPTGKLPDSALPLSYQLDLKIDPRTERFDGGAIIRVKLVKATNHVFLHARELDLEKIEALDAQGKRHAAKFTKRDDSGVIEVTFDAVLPAQVIDLMYFDSSIE